MEKSQIPPFFRKSENFENILLLSEEKKIQFSKFCPLRGSVFDQSSPVQPVSESRGCPLSVTHGRTNGETDERKSLCLILDADPLGVFPPFFQHLSSYSATTKTTDVVPKIKSEESPGFQHSKSVTKPKFELQPYLALKQDIFLRKGIF